MYRSTSEVAGNDNLTCFRRRNAMQAHLEFKNFPENFARQRKTEFLATRIRKLRWMGLDKEAEKLTAVLSRLESDDVLISDLATPD
jgi:hypothetical protein